jgi:cytochrome c-type biogenesis protein CcmH
MRKLMILCYFVCVLMTTSRGLSAGSIDADRRTHELLQELRCLVCQNQDLADSNAGLASDLRNEVQALVQKGQSNEAIKAYLQARYGDFILFKPPLKATTALLWFGPFIFLGLGLVVLLRMVMK